MSQSVFVEAEASGRPSADAWHLRDTCRHSLGLVTSAVCSPAIPRTNENRVELTHCHQNCLTHCKCSILHCRTNLLPPLLKTREVEMGMKQVHGSQLCEGSYTERTGSRCTSVFGGVQPLLSLGKAIELLLNLLKLNCKTLQSSIQLDSTTWLG